MTLAASATLIDGGAMHPGFDHRLIHSGDDFQGVGILTRHHFDDVGEAMLAVTGIDALGRVAYVKVHPALETRLTFQHRHTFLLGCPGKHGGLIDHDVAGA